MKNVLTWVEQIAAFYVLMCVVEQLLPSATYRKYAKLYLGFVFVMLVVAPFSRLPNVGEQLFEALEEAKNNVAKEDLKMEIAAGNAMRYDMILEGYREIIGEQVEAMTLKEGGVIKDIKVEFEEDVEKETFGRIQFMEIYLLGIDTPRVLERMKETLAKEYHIEQDCIVIKGKEEG